MKLKVEYEDNGMEFAYQIQIPLEIRNKKPDEIKNYIYKEVTQYFSDKSENSLTFSISYNYIFHDQEDWGWRNCTLIDGDSWDEWGE